MGHFFESLEIVLIFILKKRIYSVYLNFKDEFDFY
jgi:hypothetical protein